MKKILKAVAFVAAAGAAVAGFWYFLDRKNKDEEEYFECEPVCGDETKAEDHTYVSLNQEESCEECGSDDAKEAVSEDDKKTLKQVVKNAAMEMKQKAEDARRGVGVVAEEVKGKASEFAFKAFDKGAEEAAQAAEEAADKAEEVKEAAEETIEASNSEEA